MRLDNVIDQLTAAQHGCIAVWQLRDLGAFPVEITRMRRSSRWRPLSQRVLARAGSPNSPEQRACGAVLEAGPSAALTAVSAAAWWSLGTSYRQLPAEVMADRGAASFPGDIGRIYPRCGVTAPWITVHNGIAVVRPELCVYQLCGLVHPGRAERALDTALALQLVTIQSMQACLEEFAKRGRKGTVVLRSLLDARPMGSFRSRRDSKRGSST
jgi:hypothetical protein